MAATRLPPHPPLQRTALEAEEAAQRGAVAAEEPADFQPCRAAFQALRTLEQVGICRFPSVAGFSGLLCLHKFSGASLKKI